MMEYGLVAQWLVVYIALLLAGVPIATTLCPRLADRGVGVALPIAATILWLVGYWVGHLSLTLALWLGVGVLGGSFVALVRRGEIAFEPRVLGETVGVFTVAFLFLVAVRAVDPAVHPIGGEKFLDFGLLRSLLRADQLPPEDMWFAGEPVSYYYGGHLLASLLTRLTGTAPRFAYNLSLAGFYGMLVTAAYGLAGSISAHRGQPRRLGGLFGIFLVGFASNLSTPGRLLLWLLPEETAASVADQLSISIDGLAASPAEFHYWDASRLIEGTINEFPFFSFLNGDLHAHMMSTPFLLLVGTLLFAYFRTPETERTRRRVLVLGTLPPLAALLSVVNTWSVPTVGGLTLLALAMAPSDPRTLLPSTMAERLQFDGWKRRELVRVLVAGGIGVGVVLLGVVLSGPFWLGTASGRSIGLFPDRSGLGPLLLVHGLFVLVFVTFLLRAGLGRLQGRERLALVGTVALVVVVSIAAGASAVALCLPLIVGGWLLARFDSRASDTASASAVSATETDGGQPATPGFETVLLVAGAGLVLLVEFLYVKEQAGPGRLNTVFKTYMQVWVLWSVAAGVVLADLSWHNRPALGLTGDQWTLAFRVGAALLVVSTGIYGVLALSDHFSSTSPTAQTDDPTLDATLFVEKTHPAEAPAIRWIDQLEGQPTIVSAPGGYRWNPSDGAGASAAASLTGVPTVIGWHHEIGYRGEAAYRQRAEDVRTIYTGEPDEQARLLAKYNVSYIYFGPAELETYGPTQVAAVEGVDHAKKFDHVFIYRVDQDRLSDG